MKLLQSFLPLKWKQITLIQVGGSFHGRYAGGMSWAIIPQPSTEVNQLAWKLPSTSMEANVIPSACIEEAMEVGSISTEMPA